MYFSKSQNYIAKWHMSEEVTNPEKMLPKTKGIPSFFC